MSLLIYIYKNLKTKKNKNKKKKKKERDSCPTWVGGNSHTAPKGGGGLSGWG
jgi:hypothetical protein